MLERRDRRAVVGGLAALVSALALPIRARAAQSSKTR
jgi:hypothetical protein